MDRIKYNEASQEIKDVVHEIILHLVIKDVRHGDFERGSVGYEKCLKAGVIKNRRRKSLSTTVYTHSDNTYFSIRTIEMERIMYIEMDTRDFISRTRSL